MKGAIDQEKVKQEKHIVSVLYTNISDYSGALFFLMKERQMYAFCFLKADSEHNKGAAAHGFWRAEQKIKQYLNIL